MEKLKQREMDKKSFQDRVQGVKRSESRSCTSIKSWSSMVMEGMALIRSERKEGVELGDERFDIDVDDAIDDRPQRGGPAGRGGKPKVSCSRLFENWECS